MENNNGNSPTKDYMSARNVIAFLITLVIFMTLMKIKLARAPSSNGCMKKYVRSASKIMRKLLLTDSRAI